MEINKIISILSDYGSEKGFDFVISAVRELSKNKRLKENINELIRSELSAFENTDKDGEYDFQGLIDLLKEFGNESFVESYVYAYIENDSIEKKKELIRKECIRDTNANTQESEKSVRSIIDRCFNIIDEHLLHCLSKEDLIQTGIIKKIIKEISNQNTERIIEGIKDSTKELKELITSKDSHTIQPVCTSPTNDNQAYLDAFTNPLFLENEEEDENVLSLADMYISPSIKGKDIKASECVKKWYNTKTKPCLLLYGNAGVGKSSFVSKILADANGKAEKSKVEFDFDSSKVMAVALRNHTDKINIQLKAEEILTTLFNCDSAEQLKDKLLILDGLDELCVLKHGFKGKIFLEKLSRLEYGYHVLVTSRESGSYFTKPHDEEGLRTERLVWEEKQIKDWLDLYKAKKPRKEKWCIKFHEQLCSLETDDTRREIFCVPIILYICGTSETDIEDHSSIGSIYRDAFTKILMRKHLRGQSNTDEFKEADKEANMTAWQFTKELAYQMFLLNTLDLVDDDESKERWAIGFRNATKRTKDILKEEYKIENPDIELKKELAVCPFARENKKSGITFAHKTVYEYFTAVKLYEDYFTKFDEKYFNDNDDDTAAMDVMESFIEAFRYEAISDDIFPYLCEMKDAPFSNTLGYSKSTGLNYKKYERSFIYGMQNHIYAKISLKRAIDEYLYQQHYEHYRAIFVNGDWKSKSIEAQTSTAFANFTLFLKGHSFTNKEKIPECMLIGNFIHGSINEACFLGWNLELADLFGADLSGADFRNANLTGANFSGADLRNAKLESVNLSGANLTCANLTSARLVNSNLFDANLKGANLEYADLTNVMLKRTYLAGANLTRANLRCAKYCDDPRAKTIFPEGFDPKEHGMIEVDIDEDPVEDE